MDFEAESWDVSPEANELNNSLFNATPRLSNKKKKSTPAVLSTDAKDTPNSTKHKEKDGEEKKTVGYSTKSLKGLTDVGEVTSLNKINKRNKYLGFVKQTPDKSEIAKTIETGDHSQFDVETKDKGKKKKKLKTIGDEGNPAVKVGVYEDISKLSTNSKKRTFNESYLSENDDQTDLSSLQVSPVKKKKGKLSFEEIDGETTVKSAKKKKRAKLSTEEITEITDKSAKKKKKNLDINTKTSLENTQSNNSVLLSDMTTDSPDKISNKKKRKKSKSGEIDTDVNKTEQPSESPAKKKKVSNKEKGVSQGDELHFSITSDESKTTKQKRKRKSRKNKFKPIEAPDKHNVSNGVSAVVGEDKGPITHSLKFNPDKKGKQGKKLVKNQTELAKVEKINTSFNTIKKSTIDDDTSKVENTKEKKRKKEKKNKKAIVDDANKLCSSNNSSSAGNAGNTPKQKKGEKIQKIEAGSGSDNKTDQGAGKVNLPFSAKKISQLLAKSHNTPEPGPTSSTGQTSEKHSIKLDKPQRTKANLAKMKRTKQQKTSDSDSNDSDSEEYSTKPEKNTKKVVNGGTTKKSLLQLNLEKLEGARFRFINEQLYVRTGEEAFQLFKEDPHAFEVYHKGFQNQVEKWPVNPLDVIIDYIKSKPVNKVVADFGCGDATLAQSVSNKVHSFDLVALNNRVTVCDMAKVPLSDDTIDTAVFCLSLMGTNFTAYLTEANRVLKKGGTLVVAEVASRFGKVREFVSNVERMGFKSIDQDTENTMFVLMKFQKKSDLKDKLVKKMKLKPCVYKRR